MNRPRCINLDWLEVHCLEPVCDPHTPEYFRAVGLIVDEREYGTRVYRQMFTVYSPDGRPFVEVRRDPFSTGLNGIHSPEETHLRLVNAACYLDNAAALLGDFMAKYHYEFKRITRADICLDFEKFDSGDDPDTFLHRYIRHVYAKINQANIHAHGSDTWNGQHWNSISWGAPSSQIGTKLYNKTMELYDAASNSYRKPYIRYAWFLCGLIDDFQQVKKHKADGTEYTPQIWRLEFSIRSSVRNWFAIEVDGKRKRYQSVRNTLAMYDSRAKLIALFASLTRHYFHFKYVQYIKPRQPRGLAAQALATVQPDDAAKLAKFLPEKRPQRKDRCQDKVLFRWQDLETTYTVARDDAAHLLNDSRPKFAPLNSLLAKLRAYQESHRQRDIYQACQVLIRSIEGETLRSDLYNPFSYSELQALRQALSLKANGHTADVGVLLREIKQFLHLNDQTTPF